MHAMRRNVDIKILLFNNRIYGLTKGQYSPTSLPGHVTRSTPYGSVDAPLHPLSIALGCEATFVARSGGYAYEAPRRSPASGGRTLRHRLCRDLSELQRLQRRSLRLRKGSEAAYGRPRRDRPRTALVFGTERDKGIRLDGFEPQVVSLDDGGDGPDLLVHDETAPEPVLASVLARMRHPALPEAIGVFRAIERPTFDTLVQRTDRVRPRPGRSGRPRCPARVRRHLDRRLKRGRDAICSRRTNGERPKTAGTAIGDRVFLMRVKARSEFLQQLLKCLGREGSGERFEPFHEALERNCERGLADLARSEEGHRGRLVEVLQNALLVSPFDHPCQFNGYR